MGTRASDQRIRNKLNYLHFLNEETLKKRISNSLYKGQEIAQIYVEYLLAEKPLVNYRPDWLCGLEYDMFFPENKVAIEFQGDQHYIPIFGEESLESQIERDRKKRELSLINNVKLVTFDICHLYAFGVVRRLRQSNIPTQCVFGLLGRNKFLMRMDIIAKEYRDYWKDSGSVSAFKRKKRIALSDEWREKNGMTNPGESVPMLNRL
jgi:hypothetical protein